MIKNGELFKKNKNLWLIIVDTNEWVFEYSSGILWYNYSFFVNIFKYLNESPLSHRDNIHKWFSEMCNDNFDVLPMYNEKMHILELFPNIDKIKDVKWREVKNHPTYLDDIISLQNKSY
jgi:hypothetical protein